MGKQKLTFDEALQRIADERYPDASDVQSRALSWGVALTKADGTRGTVARFLELPALRPGHWWVNSAPMGAGFNHWVETIAPTKGNQ